MKKKQIEINEIRGQIASRISELGINRREFIDQMLADEKCPAEVKEKTPGTIMVSLSDSGPASFPILSGIYAYLKLGKLAKEEKVQHIKTTKYYVSND